MKIRIIQIRKTQKQKNNKESIQTLNTDKIQDFKKSTRISGKVTHSRLKMLTMAWVIVAGWKYPMT